MRRLAALVRVVTSVSVGALACGEGGSPVTREPVDSTVRAVLVIPENATITIGGHVQLATAVDAGLDATDRSVAWSSSNATTASVSQLGLVTSGSVTGIVTITARSNADTNVKGTSVITVTSTLAPPLLGPIRQSP